MRLRDSRVARFFPAIVTCAMWLYVLSFDPPALSPTALSPAALPSTAAPHVAANATASTTTTLWSSVFDAESRYYAMGIAMIGGSLIAGSTPLGGGVVAFPVAVLVLGLTPSQGRDFTCLIQSVGMNAAAYTLWLTKPHLVDGEMVATYVMFGLPTLLLALRLELPPFATVFTFQLLVLEFALVYAYVDLRARWRAAVPPPPSSSPSRRGSTPSPLRRTALATSTALATHTALATRVVSALVGGFFCGTCGSGSGILLYAHGALAWNAMVPPSRRLSDAALTASSVVTMGLLSVVGALARALTAQVTREVYLCWGAAAWIVCFGAPLGSLCLTPSRQGKLRGLFYVVAVGQFVGFAALKMRDAAAAWAAAGGVTAAVAGALMGHEAWVRRTMGRAATATATATASARQPDADANAA